MNFSKLFIIIGIVIIVGFGYLILSRTFFRDDSFNLPIGGESRTETIFIDEDGQVVEPKDTTRTTLQEVTTREIMVTDGVRHSIPLEEIQTLLSRDGIPSIDSPKFISVSAAEEWLNDREPGIAFSRGNTHRFYPYLILAWHEIVNDTVGGERVLVTYCPLCLTGFVLDPLVKGERVEFGTSGKLWLSNLIMYDRKTDSLWSQVLAEAITGEVTGTRLSILPSDQMRYGEWKKKHPKGEVLSRDTGESRSYGRYPYAGGDYFGVDGLSLRMVNPTDTRLPNNAYVFGITVQGKTKAYHTEAVKAKGVITDEFAGETFVLRHDTELDVVRMFRKLSDGAEERINPISGFWFSWAAAHPDTELLK